MTQCLMPFPLAGTGSLCLYSPTYSLGGDSRRSAQPVRGLPVAFSSSVLLVSTISLSSVEMTCCCFLGFFLGEAPGMSSPVAGVLRLEVWVVEGADDKFVLGSKRQQWWRKSLLHISLSIEQLLQTHMLLTWLRCVHCFHLLLYF